MTRIGSEAWSRGWWILSLDQLGTALSAASTGTWASLGDVIVELDGMCIGGPLSSAAVATRFFQEELAAKIPSTQLQWKRFVDDLLAVSRCICATCLEKFFKSLFSEPLSKVYNSDEASQPFFEWLTLEMHLVGGSLVWALKNSNRSFFFRRGDHQFFPACLCTLARGPSFVLQAVKRNLDFKGCCSG